MTRGAIGLLCCVVATAASWPLSAAYQVSVKAAPVRSFQQKSHLGGGATLSADGSTMAYVGADRALHLLNIASWNDSVLLKITPSGSDVFSDPCFSPDGRAIAFSASGGTQYYPAEIYSVRTDGTDLRQLTTSSPLLKDGKQSEYFHAPKYSPDGLQLLVWHQERTDDGGLLDTADLMDADGSHRTQAGNGRPVSWVESGKSILVTREDEVFWVGLATGREQPVEGLVGRIVGRLSEDWLGRDIVALADSSNVFFATVHDAFVEPPGPSPFPLRKTRDGSPTRGRSDELQLQSVHFDNAGDRALLYYKAELGSDETFDIVDVQGLGR